MPVYNPKKSFTLSGEGLNFINRVYFGEDQVEELFYLGSTGVSGEIPSSAMTADLTAQTNDGILNLGRPNIVLDSSSQVLVSGLLPEYVSGQAGDTIVISGENFHKITNVNFGAGLGSSGESGQFSVISDQILEVIVPTGASYDGVTVFSSLRTGLNNNQTFASGKSYNNFIPIPNVTGINSGMLAKDSEFIIGGVNMSGVTGVSVNDIIFNQSSFESLGKTGVKVTVPTGYAQGRPNLLLQSGVSHLAPEEFSFNPLAEIVGVSAGNIIGSQMTISGHNFSSGMFYTGLGSLTGSLVEVGEKTGLFTQISDAGGYNRLRGYVPTGISILLSGGNISAGVTPDILHLPVSIFTPDYPVAYPSDKTFRPGIGSPSVSLISPTSGIGGDLVTISGENLFGITGVVFDAGNAGIGSEGFNFGVTEVIPGKQITATVPQVSYDTAGGFLDIKVSGAFGNVGVEEGFFIYGRPKINTVIPGGSGILPGATGTIYGERLYSGSEVLLYGGNGGLASSNFIQKLNISGYRGDNAEIVFSYPNSFVTGNTYGIRVENQRGYHISPTNTYKITGFHTPSVGGVSLVSGTQGESVAISGYFEEISPSGLKIGETVVSDFTRVSTTGIVFNIPTKTTSNLINIETSGGFASTTGILNIALKEPTISGYYHTPSFTGVNTYYDSSDQVFAESNVITITGERLNLVTGIVFSGNNQQFGINEFTNKNNSSLTFRLPTGINAASGNFITKDFKNRDSLVPLPINVFNLSGYNNFVLPGQDLTLSGTNLTGLNVAFDRVQGGQIIVEPHQNLVSGGTDVLVLTMPTGVVGGTAAFSGRNSDDFFNFAFDPTPVVTGTVGFGSALQAGTGNLITITGVNFPTGVSSGDFAIGITGTGNSLSKQQVDLIRIESATGVVGAGTNVATSLGSGELSFRLPNTFIGTGQFFINTNNSLAFQDDIIADLNSTGIDTSLLDYDFVRATTNFLGTNFKITGDRVNATGYGPTRGVTGQAVEFTGHGLRAVREVYFQAPSGDLFNSQFNASSDTKLTAYVPEEAIEARGTANIIFSGGTNQEVGPFEIILDASVVEFNIVEEDDVPTSSSRVGNFTQKETINGTVFLVTRTRFPDGTTAIVSSTPQA